MRYLIPALALLTTWTGIAMAAEDGVYVKASYGVPWMVMFLIFFLILTPLVVAVLVSWMKMTEKKEK